VGRLIDAAKIAGLRQVLDRDGFVRFKNGSTVKVERDGLLVRRARLIVSRHRSAESAYRRAIKPLSRPGARLRPRPRSRTDFGVTAPF
jgi:hypothetical protein